MDGEMIERSSRTYILGSLIHGDVSPNGQTIESSHVKTLPWNTIMNYRHSFQL